MTKAFEIYFSDLNDEAKQELLEFVGVDDPSDMNWDIDILPIAYYEIEANDPCSECQEFNCDGCEYADSEED